MCRLLEPIDQHDAPKMMPSPAYVPGDDSNSKAVCIIRYSYAVNTRYHNDETQYQNLESREKKWHIKTH